MATEKTTAPAKPAVKKTATKSVVSTSPRMKDL